MAGKIERQVIMTRKVAREFLRRIAYAEYRFEVLYGSREIKQLPNLLRSQRAGKVALEEVPTIPDLGIKEEFDKIALWSRDHKGIMALKDWFEKRGFETTGVW